MTRCSITQSAVVVIGAVHVFLTGCSGTSGPSDSQPNGSRSSEQAAKVSVSFDSARTAFATNVDEFLVVQTIRKADADVAISVPAGGSKPVGRVVGTVKWKGALPTRELVPMTKDGPVCAQHGGHNRFDDRLIVDASTGGIKDSVINLVGRYEGDKPLNELRYPDTLNQRGCTFEPRVMVVPIGVRLGMTSEDDVGHNVRMTGAAEINLAISKGSRVTRRLEQGGLIHVACDVHPWMSGYIHVAKHPYYVVSESDGRFELTDVPAGTHQIKLWHEAWWKEQGKQPDPLVITRSVLVEAGATTELVFELPHPTPSRVAGVPSNKSGSKLR